jgi:hypothetical protein
MRALRCFIILVVVGLLAVSAYAGGKGAMVDRGHEGWILWFYWDGAVTGPRNVLYWSTFPDWGEFFVCGTEWPPYDGLRTQAVYIPSPEFLGFKFNEKLFGPNYARVLYLDPDTDIPWGDLCGFFRSETFANPIAEGMVQFHMTSTNSCKFGPGRNQWYWRVTGELVDLRGTNACTSGTVHVTMLDHWMLRTETTTRADCNYSADDAILIKFTPPTLRCGDR